MQWHDLPLLTGSLTVNVNNSWFPQPADEGQNKTWTMYGWFLPAGRNATQMLLETETTYPRPFNWSVVRKCFYYCLSFHCYHSLLSSIYIYI